jgi:hypothetical protein
LRIRASVRALPRRPGQRLRTRDGAGDLPFDGLPVASELLAGSCREVEFDDTSARTATAAI